MFELKQFLFKTHTFSTLISAFLQTLKHPQQVRPIRDLLPDWWEDYSFLVRTMGCSGPMASCTAGTVSSRTCLDEKKQRDKGGDLGDSSTSPPRFLFDICFPINSLHSLFILPRLGQIELPFPPNWGWNTGPRMHQKMLCH